MSRINVPVDEMTKKHLDMSLIIPDSEVGHYNAGVIKEIRQRSDLTLILCQSADKFREYRVRTFVYFPGEIVLLEQ